MTEASDGKDDGDATDAAIEVGTVLRSVSGRQRWIFVAGLLMAMAFAFGWLARGWARPPVLVGSGYVGQDVATLFVGNDAYGVRGSVNWTDAHGSFHDHGWPDCLPRLQAVSGIRFTGGTVPVGDGSGVTAVDEVFWLDCSGG